MIQCKKCKLKFKNNGAFTIHDSTCKLNSKIIKDIINDYIINTLSIRDIIKKYHIGNTTIRHILKNKLRNKKEAFKVCKTGFKTHTILSKAKLSKAMMGNRNANHRGDRQSYYKNIRMDSSWEVLVAIYLDKQKYNWKYSSERYLLSTGQYLHPDFFIYDKYENIEKIIEVKGYFREANKVKFELFKNEYPQLIIELWNKEVLKKLKIIK